MKAATITRGILKALAIIIGVVFLFWFLYEIQSVIIYIAIAAVISLIGRPVVIFLKRRLKLNDTLAAITTILIVMAGITGVLSLFIPVVVDQSEHLSAIDFEKVRLNINRLYSEIAAYFGVDKMTIIEGVKQTDFVRNFDFGMIPSFLNGLIGNLGAGIVGLFSVIFISFFFLKDNKLLVSSILIFAKRGDEGKFLRVFDKIKYLLSRYFIGLLAQVTIMFILYAILLSIFRIENAFAIAVFCATLNLVPYLGPLVGGGVMLLLATSSNLDADFQTVLLPKLIYIFIGYAIAQMIDNFIIQPLIFGNSVKSHPLEIFIIIIIAGLIFGVIGMILAIPTYTAIKVISKEFLSEYKIVQKLTSQL